MQQTFQCFKCGAQNYVGQPFCWNCQSPFQWNCPNCKASVQNTMVSCPNCHVLLPWPTQQQATQQYQQQLNHQQQAPSGGRRTVSVCINCEFQNNHDVDHNGDATVTCPSCSTVYDVKTYQVRAKGGRRDKSSGIKHYNIRVKEPDRDETILEFDSIHEIEMRSGDWITGSYFNGQLKYLLNQNIKRYWDVEIIKQKAGCLTMIALIAFPIALLVVGLLVL